MTDVLPLPAEPTPALQSSAVEASVSEPQQPHQWAVEGKGTYVRGRALGEIGPWSAVYAAVPMSAGTNVLTDTLAVKVFDKTRMDAHDKAHMQNECAMALRIEAACVRELARPPSEMHLGVHHLVRLVHIDETETHVSMFMQYARGGDLLDFMNETRMRYRTIGVQPDVARRIFSQLASAVDFLHRRARVVHRDIKPENIFMYSRGSYDIVLGDWGLAAAALNDNDDEDACWTMNKWCGSVAYAAPEMLLGKAYDGRRVDWWSVGIVLYAMLYGEPPFGLPVNTERLQHVMHGIVHSPIKYPLTSWGIDAMAREIIDRLLHKTPECRANAAEVFAHAYTLLLLRKTPHAAQRDDSKNPEH